MSTNSYSCDHKTVPSPERSLTVERHHPVTPVLITMCVIMAIAFAIVGLVTIGVQGLGRRWAPKVAHTMSRTVAHLNGDGQPPRVLSRTH